jgi:hypothetical protein
VLYRLAGIVSDRAHYDNDETPSTHKPNKESCSTWNEEMSIMKKDAPKPSPRTTLAEDHLPYNPPEVTTYTPEELEELIGPALTGSAWN